MQQCQALELDKNLFWFIHNNQNKEKDIDKKADGQDFFKKDKAINVYVQMRDISKPR